MSAGALSNVNNIPGAFVGTAGVPTYFSDLVLPNYQAGLTNYNSNSEWATLRGKLTASFEDYTVATGKQRFDLFPIARAKYEKGYSSKPEDFEHYDAEIARLKEEDAEKYGHLKSFSEIQESALAQSRNDKSTLDNAIYRAAPGTSVFGAAMVGGVGAAFHDPINIASTLIGAGAATSLAKTFIFEAGVNVLAETAIQPFVMEYQEKLGHEYGVKEAAIAIAAGGLFGGTLSVAMKGASRGITRVLANSDEVSPTVRDAARTAEDNQHTFDNNPASSRDFDAHVRDYIRASQDVANGRNVDLSAQSSVAYARWLETVDQDTKRMWDEVISGADVDEVVTGRLVEQLTKWRNEIVDDPVYKSLPDVEVKELQAQIKEVEAQLKKPRKVAEVKQELKEADPTLSDKDAGKLARKSVAEQKQELQNLKQSLDERVANGTEHEKLGREIEALKKGVVPTRHRETVSTMKAGINGIDGEYKAIELAEANRLGDEFQAQLEANNVVPTRTNDQEVVEESIEHRTSPEFEAEMNAEFERALTANPDELIIDPDTGDLITLRELQDKLDADAREFSQISSCGVNR